MGVNREPDITSENKKGRVRWLGYVERMPEKNNCDESVLRISQREKGPLESLESDDWNC